ncbi:hypothetical protein [Catenulispora pinisilvae]|uniref:hypothetical protein n=1 Tax=Catenulispora pinisilvae TaxID=2705253 RepID=UPI0018910597|nr:hypothetical protein [Catenulispora pinisilvae]
MRLFRKKNPETAPAGRPATEQPAAKQTEIGILFDIDALGGGFYGPKAYQVLFQTLDPQRLKRCSFHDGDTNATIFQGARLYCIAIRSPAPHTIDYVRELIGARTDPGLLAPSERFVDGDVTEWEPLVPAGFVNEAAQLVVKENDMIHPSVAEGTAWRVVIG